MEERYPGETCDVNEIENFCYHGYAECFHGRCRGYGLNEKCFSSKQCEIGYYCSENNLCERFKK